MKEANAALNELVSQRNILGDRAINHAITISQLEAEVQAKQKENAELKEKIKELEGETQDQE